MLKVNLGKLRGETFALKRDDFLDIKESIKAEAEKIGLDMIGFTDCSPLEGIREVLLEREKKGYLSGLEEGDIEKRINPGLLLDNCHTIISAGVSYLNEKPVHNNGKHFKCSIARSSWGTDYHNVLGKKLSSLCNYIREVLHGEATYFVDTGPLPEREVARKAGIGFIGKNGFLINPEYGSFIFLGEILTTLSIEPDSPIEDGCGECDLCIKACPTGALMSPRMLNARGCISFMTQCKNIQRQQLAQMGTSIYGCDICQVVCPKNREAKKGKHKEFIPESWNCCPDPVEILKMNNKMYNETFKRTSSGWRGKKVLQRNAIIALGNSGDLSAALHIIKMLSDERKDIREISIYALFNLLGSESKPILEEHIKNEDSEDIRNIIKSILDEIK